MVGAENGGVVLPAAASPGGQRRHDVLFRAQFRNTELCKFFSKGWCAKGPNCEFAHGKDELQPAPDLTKTALCRKWQRFCCQRPSDQCPFAHGPQELRKTDAYARGPPGTFRDVPGADSARGAVREGKVCVDGDTRMRCTSQEQEAGNGCGMHEERPRSDRLREAGWAVLNAESAIQGELQYRSQGTAGAAPPLVGEGELAVLHPQAGAPCHVSAYLGPGMGYTQVQVHMAAAAPPLQTGGPYMHWAMLPIGSLPPWVVAPATGPVSLETTLQSAMPVQYED